MKHIFQPLRIVFYIFLLSLTLASLGGRKLLSASPLDRQLQHIADDTAKRGAWLYSPSPLQPHSPLAIQGDKCPIHAIESFISPSNCLPCTVAKPLRMRYRPMQSEVELSWDPHIHASQMRISAYSLLGDPVLRLSIDEKDSSVLMDTRALMNGIYVILLETLDGIPIGQGRLVVTHPAREVKGEKPTTPIVFDYSAS